MGNEERERKFEQALERHLRRDAAGARHEEEARADVRDETGGAVTCLDAETLAAFHEQILSSEEMNIAAEHIESCSRCQQILMQLEATDEIPLQAEPEDIFAKREPVLSASGLHVDDPTRQGLSPSIAGQTRPGLKTPKDISRGRGFKTLRWAAPAGAIAAGLLIWFVVRDSKVQTLGHVENVQVAQEQPINGRLTAPRALPASPAPEPVTKTEQLNERRKDADKIKRPGEESGGLRAPERQLSDAFSTRDDLDVHAETSDAGVPAASRESKLDALQSVTRAKPESRASSHNKVDVDAATATAAAVPAPAPSGDPHAQSGGPIPTPPAASSGATPKAANQKAEAAHSYTAKTIVDEQPALETEQVATTDRLQSQSLVLIGKAVDAKKILAPGGTVLWRVGTAGRIEQSADNGVTWRPQNSGVKVELLAGSAASEAVCWVVGRSGTILRTTDGGGHWSKVFSPIPGDVAGIRGVDAMTVEIVGANKIARFITQDGGVTWKAAKD